MNAFDHPRPDTGSKTPGDNLETQLKNAGDSQASPLGQHLASNMDTIFGVAQRRPSQLNAGGSAEVCQPLNQALADCIDLQLQCRQARWDLDSHSVSPTLRRLEVAESMAADHADRLAAHIVRRGGRARMTASAVAEYSGLPDYPAANDGHDGLDVLTRSLAVIAASVAVDSCTLSALGDPQAAAALSALESSARDYRDSMRASGSRTSHG